MAHSSRSRFPRARGSFRKTTWSAGPLSGAVQSATAAGTTIISTGASLGGVLTLVRIRGELTVWLEAVGTIGDGFTRVHAGIGIVSTDAFTAGAASMPTPIGDADWGWLWYYAGGVIAGFSVTESENTGPISQIRIPIDTKAMRKMTPNETVFGAVQFHTEIGVATASFVMNTRMLSKLV